MSSGASARRRAQRRQNAFSDHCCIPEPRPRPAHLPVQTDPRILGIGLDASCCLAVHLPPAWRGPYGRAAAAMRLRVWGKSLPSILLTSGLAEDVLDDMHDMPADLIFSINDWMAGRMSDWDGLEALAWRIGMGEQAVGGLAWLYELALDRDTP